MIACSCVKDEASGCEQLGTSQGILGGVVRTDSMLKLQAQSRLAASYLHYSFGECCRRGYNRNVWTARNDPKLEALIKQIPHSKVRVYAYHNLNPNMTQSCISKLARCQHRTQHELALELAVGCHPISKQYMTAPPALRSL